MAKIIRSYNPLESDMARLKKNYILWSALTIVCFILFLPTHGLTFIPFIICGFICGKYARPYKARKIGLKGETRTREIFEKLSDDYTVISNMNINLDGKTTVLDHMVIGPNGVFVIKTKNVNGKIVGAEDDSELIQHKVGRKGGRYKKNFYNPIKQLNSNVFKLSKLLKNYNLDSRVQGIVYFTNPDCRVDINAWTTPIFSCSGSRKNDFAEYITNYNQGIPMPIEKKEAIERILTSFVNDKEPTLANSK